MATTTDTRNLGWFITFLVAVVVLLVLMGVGVFMRAGRVSFDKAVALGEAVTSDSASLFDKALIAAKAEALGVTVSFSPEFAQNGQVVVNSWIPQASVCLYLPSTGGWATRVSDEPCEEVVARDGPEAVPPDERAMAGISDPQPWADEDDPLIAVGHGSQASGYGEVYVQAHVPNAARTSWSMGSTWCPVNRGPRPTSRPACRFDANPSKAASTVKSRKACRGALPQGRSLPRPP